MAKSRSGFSIVEFLIILAVVGVLGLAWYIVVGKSKNHDKQAPLSQAQIQSSNDGVVWSYSDKEGKWVASGNPPACPQPLKFSNSPIDVTKAPYVLMPGQYRGFNYKPHGAFSLYGSQTGEIEVKLPMDATITGLTRYLESPDKALQYVVDFVNPCGIAFRFDHLNVLSPRLQAIADTRPEAKLDDTKSDPSNAPKPELFKAGEVIATAVGHPDIKNFGFDFGVYDYRQANEISKNPAWAALHSTYKASEWYGVCWFDMLPGGDADYIKNLSLKPINPQKPNIISDYCKNAPHTTLDFNGGKPTDG